MFSGKFRICDVFGIPVYLDMSLIILLVLFVTGGSSFIAGLACAVALAVSITLHELGHALTARAFGYQTRDITLSLLGGCASLISMPRKAYQEFLTAIAGPAVSFALSAFGIVGIVLTASQAGFGDASGFVVSEVLESFGLHVELGNGIFVDPGRKVLVEMMFYLSSINMMLGIFNLLPGFPMDGGRVFRSVMRQFTSRVKATYIAMVVGRVVAVGIGLKGLWSLFNGGNWGVVSILIAWMIWREGWREYVLAVQEERWGSPWEYSARVSRPPYDDGDDDEVEVRRKR